MSELNIQATGTKIIVKLLKPRVLQPQGQIVLPDNSQQAVKPQFYGLVISIGEEIKNVEMDDVIVFHPNGGQDMVLENNVCKGLNYDEIYGIESRQVDMAGKDWADDDFFLALPQESNIVQPQGPRIVQ